MFASIGTPGFALMDLETITTMLKNTKAFAHKKDIAPVLEKLGIAGSRDIAVGDDCAAIPDGDGFLLFAIEGFMAEFISAEPYFAGYCGVMVNLSDIAAMGGRPIAVVDALWSRDNARARPILAGLADAAARYGVPVVGGHTNAQAESEMFSVAVLGRAKNLLTSFDARPGENLIAAIDLRGFMHDSGLYWDASTRAAPADLRACLELLPTIADQKLCAAAKDISMAGVIGTALMLLEGSGLGARINPDTIPRPEHIPLENWLLVFPSFGFLLSVSHGNTPEVLEKFTVAGISAAVIGHTDTSGMVRLAMAGKETIVWNLAEQSFIGCKVPIDA